MNSINERLEQLKNIFSDPGNGDWYDAVTTKTNKIKIGDVFKQFSKKEILDHMNIEDIETYLRTKKIQRLRKK